MMDSALRLLLLSLSVAKIHGNGFIVTQPPGVEGVERGSVDIPCSFTYPASFRPGKFRISWRRNRFHGEFIFNVSTGFVHPDYRYRIQFLGKPDTEKTGTIRINHLRRSDRNKYFCRVETTGYDPQMWQSVPGTTLTVRDWHPGKTSTPTVTTTPNTGTVALQDTAERTNTSRWALWIGGIAGGALLICLALVLAIYIRKRKKWEGNVKQGSTESAPSLSDIPSRNEDQQTDPPNQSQSFDEAQGSEGIIYASLQVKGNTSPRNNVAPADSNILYAAVKFQDAPK